MDDIVNDQCRDLIEARKELHKELAEIIAEAAAKRSGFASKTLDLLNELDTAATDFNGKVSTLLEKVDGVFKKFGDKTFELGTDYYSRMDARQQGFHQSIHLATLDYRGEKPPVMPKAPAIKVLTAEEQDENYRRMVGDPTSDAPGAVERANAADPVGGEAS
jgi:hypothetical protein